MFIKCLVFLTLLCVLEAQFRTSQCTMPRLLHGKVRGRRLSKLIKFTCSSGYELVGNRYATCKNGVWDTPLPTCVRPGCDAPEIKNGLVMLTRNDSWAIFFCFPDHRLVGAPVIYCDGRRWNATAPTCVDSKTPAKLSCDFEQPDLCGWTQDSLHDFDWERLNRKTPSSFLQTGPSYDHTYGKHGSGYYMYIESSSRLVNETARLISPIYSRNLSIDGCFAFYYHMFGRDIGGLRVYQKPDSIPLEQILRLPDKDRSEYVLFEMWGNQGDVWYGDVVDLTDYKEDFQIVIEGIRGMKFTSDIAIDDVAILQKDMCAKVKRSMSTPAPFVDETCEGRCGNSSNSPLRCGCTFLCFADNSCCSDYYETCLYNDEQTTAASTEELPQTQKLVAKSIAPPITTTTTTTKKSTFAEFSPEVTVKVVIKNPTTVATKKLTTKTPNVTIFQKDAINDKTDESSTTIRTTTTKATTTKIIALKSTTKQQTVKINTTPKPTLKTTVKTTTSKPTVIVKTTKVPKVTDQPKKSAKNKQIEKDFLQQSRRDNVPEKSSAWRGVLITLLVLVCAAGTVWLVIAARGSRGRAALAALRGRITHDPEVRYLHADTDDME